LIILQILAGIVLIPLTLALLLAFNFYIRHWIWQLGVIGFFLLYACIIALVFLNAAVAIGAVAIIIATYCLRMRYMAFRIKKKEVGRPYPIVKGDIIFHHVKFRTELAFPISFLNIARLTPGVVNRKLSKRSGLEINLGKLIPLILRKGKGTEVSVSTQQADIYFEFQ
jgi:hypothetical protein